MRIANRHRPHAAAAQSVSRCSVAGEMAPSIVAARLIVPRGCREHFLRSVDQYVAKASPAMSRA